MTDQHRNRSQSAFPHETRSFVLSAEDRLTALCGADPQEMDTLRLAGDARFEAWIKGQLLAFDPDHDAPLGVEPPPVTLMCSTRDLNGEC